MQFGIFSVGDVTVDPTDGTAPSEHERIKAMVTLALKAEEVGLDVFATGEHHNPPFVPSSPTTSLGYIAARTQKLILSTATTLISESSMRAWRHVNSMAGVNVSACCLPRTDWVDASTPSCPPTATDTTRRPDT